MHLDKYGSDASKPSGDEQYRSLWKYTDKESESTLTFAEPIDMQLKVRACQRAFACESVGNIAMMRRGNSVALWDQITESGWC